MVRFSLWLRYEGEDFIRLVARGCDKRQLLDVLDRHLLLAEVLEFSIEVSEGVFVPFKEFTL